MQDTNVMTQERWDSLTDADRCLLTKLGVGVDKPKKKYEKVNRNPITVERRMSTRNTAPEEYFTKIHKLCGCCKRTLVLEGKMIKKKHSDTFLSLSLQEIPVGEVFKKISGVSVTCGHCDVELDKLSKDELIRMVITLREVSAKKCAL